MEPTQAASPQLCQDHTPDDNFEVICDGCGMNPAPSFDRFKCMVCDDYDLCGRCFEKRKEIHPEHDEWSKPATLQPPPGLVPMTEGGSTFGIAQVETTTVRHLEGASVADGPEEAAKEPLDKFEVADQHAFPALARTGDSMNISSLGSRPWLEEGSLPDLIAVKKTETAAQKHTEITIAAPACLSETTAMEEELGAITRMIHPECMERLEECSQKRKRVEKAKAKGDVEELVQQAKQESLRTLIDQHPDPKEVEFLLQQKLQFSRQVDGKLRNNYETIAGKLAVSKQSFEREGLGTEAEALMKVLQEEQAGVTEKNDRSQRLYDKRHLENAGGLKAILVAEGLVAKSERDRAKLDREFTGFKLQCQGEKIGRAEEAVECLMLKQPCPDKFEKAILLASAAESVHTDVSHQHKSYCSTVVELQDEITAIPRQLENSSECLQKEIDQGYALEAELVGEKEERREVAAAMLEKAFVAIVAFYEADSAAAAQSHILKKNCAKLANLEGHTAAAKGVADAAIKEIAANLEVAQLQCNAIEESASELAGAIKTSTAALAQATVLNNACALAYTEKLEADKKSEKLLCELEVAELKKIGEDIEDGDTSNAYGAFLDQMLEKKAQDQACAGSLKLYEEQRAESCRRIEHLSSLGLDVNVKAQQQAAADVVGKSYWGKSVFEDQYQRKKMEQQRQLAIVPRAKQEQYSSDDED